MSIFTLYLLTRLEPLNNVFITMMIFSFVLTFFTSLFFIISWDVDGIAKEEKVQKIVRKVLVVLGLSLSVSALGSILTPTNKDIAVIVGGYWATNSEEVVKLPDNVVKTMNKFLKEYNEEAKPE